MHLLTHHRSRRNHPGAFGRKGFTLVEIMIVVAIIGIILASSVPMIWKSLNKNELARAVNDVVEGCKAARDRSILNGVPYELVISEKQQVNVRPMPALAKDPADGAFGLVNSPPPPVSNPGSLMGAFPRTFGEGVQVQMLDVNFADLSNIPEARVRFFPNGTSDEFTIVLLAKGVQRIITLDIITALAQETTP